MSLAAGVVLSGTDRCPGSRIDDRSLPSRRRCGSGTPGAGHRWEITSRSQLRDSPGFAPVFPFGAPETSATSDRSGSGDDLVAVAGELGGGIAPERERRHDHAVDTEVGEGAHLVEGAVAERPPPAGGQLDRRRVATVVAAPSGAPPRTTGPARRGRRRRGRTRHRGARPAAPRRRCGRRRGPGCSVAPGAGAARSR